MTVSAVSLAVQEGTALATGSFVRAGVPHIVWATPIGGGGGARKLNWKAHNGANFTEKFANHSDSYKNLSCLLIPSTDQLHVFWDDDGGPLSGSDGNVFHAVFDPDTGVKIAGPTVISKGMKPAVMFKGGTPGLALVVAYALRSKGVFYIRETSNGGTSWTDARPVLTNQVLGTEEFEAVPFDANHISVAQVGGDSRKLTEIGVLDRTRPVTHVAMHPTSRGRIIVAEPVTVAAGNTYDVGNTRGGVVPSLGGEKVFTTTTARVGNDDGIGAVALLNVEGPAPVHISSVTPVAASIVGDDIAFVNAVGDALTAGTSTDLWNTSGVMILSIARSENFVYVTGAETALVDRGAAVYQISNQANAAIFGAESLGAGRAVGVGMPLIGSPIVFIAQNDNTGEKLSIYRENALAPTLLATHNLPAIARHIHATMESETSGTVYISFVDRLSIYRYRGPAFPLQLLSNVPLLGRGRLFQSVLAKNGNLICAAGIDGVMVYSPSGRLLAQTQLSGLQVSEWKPNTVYALNALVRARSTHSFAPENWYFRVTTAGTSGAVEPAWTNNTTANSIVDAGTLRWQAVEQVYAVCTGVALDEDSKRIYATAVLGGELGTKGRVYILDAKQLLAAKKKRKYQATDDRVIVHWNFNDPAGWVSPFTVPDQGGRFELTIVNAPIVVPAPTGNARRFNGTTQGLTSISNISTNNPSVRTDLLGQWACMVWITPNVHSVDGLMVAYQANGETQAVNALLSFSYTTDNRIRMTWESGVGVNHSAESPANAITPGQRVHVAALKVQNGATYDLTVFINGQQVGQSLGLPNADGATSTAVGWSVSRIIDSAVNFFNGDMEEVVVVKNSSVAEIQEHYRRGAVDAEAFELEIPGKNPPQGMLLDANTFALWRLGDMVGTTVSDLAGTRHLTAVGNPQKVIGQVGQALGFTGVEHLSRAGDATIAALFTSSEWTLEALVKFDPGVLATNTYIFSYAGSGDTLATNSLCSFALEADRHLASFWEFGAGGTNVSADFDRRVAPGIWYHLALRKRPIGTGATFGADLVINGEVVQTLTGLSNAAGGTSAFLEIGRFGGGGNNLFGAINEIRISNVARPIYQLRESYKRVMGI